MTKSTGLLLTIAGLTWLLALVVSVRAFVLRTATPDMCWFGSWCALIATILFFSSVVLQVISPVHAFQRFGSLEFDPTVMLGVVLSALAGFMNAFIGYRLGNRAELLEKLI